MKFRPRRALVRAAAAIAAVAVPMLALAGPVSASASGIAGSVALVSNSAVAGGAAPACPPDYKEFGARFSSPAPPPAPSKPPPGVKGTPKTPSSTKTSPPPMQPAVVKLATTEKYVVVGVQHTSAGDSLILCHKGLIKRDKIPPAGSEYTLYWWAANNGAKPQILPAGKYMVVSPGQGPNGYAVLRPYGTSSSNHGHGISFGDVVLGLGVICACVYAFGRQKRRS